MEGTQRGGDLNYQYTGQDCVRQLTEYEDELGLHNFRARFYDSDLMRFYVVDPQEQFASPYLYCGNNPIIFVDVNGEEFKIAQDNTKKENEFINWLSDGQEDFIDIDEKTGQITITDKDKYDASKSAKAGLLADLINNKNVDATWTSSIDLEKDYPNEKSNLAIYAKTSNEKKPTMITAVDGGIQSVIVDPGDKKTILWQSIVENDPKGNNILVGVNPNAKFSYNGKKIDNKFV